jgi:hypothetical protein
MEGFIDLYQNDDTSGNRPHFRGFLKIDGVKHEFALWPAKEGRKGYSGKYKPHTERQAPVEKPVTIDDGVPF